MFTAVEVEQSGDASAGCSRPARCWPGSSRGDDAHGRLQQPSPPATCAPESLFATDVLMFIGGGSAGTAGGIKVTTFGLLAFVIWAEMRGEPRVNVGRRRDAARPTSGRRWRSPCWASALVVAATFVLLGMTEHRLDRVLFEAVSAFGTVGHVHRHHRRPAAAGHLLLVALMFIGRIGPLTLASALALRERQAAGTSCPRRGRSLADSSPKQSRCIGLGRFGSALALELSPARHRGARHRQPSESSCRAWPASSPHVVAADTTDIEALQANSVSGSSDRAVVAIGSDMQASILTTALLAELEVADIWAKASGPQHGRILDRVGAHHVVLPEHEMGERVAHLASGRMLDYIELDDDFAMVKIKPPRVLVGTVLDGEEIRKRYDVNIVSVKTEGAREFSHVAATTSLSYGSEILVVGKADDIERFAELS